MLKVMGDVAGTSSVTTTLSDVGNQVCFSIGKKQKQKTNLYLQALEEGENIEELSENVKDKRSDTYKTNFSKKMIHRDEEHPHQKPYLECSDYFHVS